MKKKALTVIAALLIIISTAHFYRTFDPQITVCRWPYKKDMAFVITCDDISAGYPLEYLQEIESLLKTHRMRATFFVIPYHGEWDLLTDSPEFVEALHGLQNEGHEIGLHGYAHYEDEFVCPPEEQAQLLEKALSIMEEAGFTVRGFRAPCLRTTEETLTILKEHNFVYDSSIFGESGDISFDHDLPQVPSGHEYTWYITEEELFEKIALATQEFEAKYHEGSIFSVVTHMKAVNEGEGMRFLEQFLSYVAQQECWNFTLEELVGWELQKQNVTWKSRKTITGGDITFSNIPEGLAVTIVLPPYYYVKAPPSVEVAVEHTDQHHIFELTFHQHFKEVTIPFGLTYKSSPPTLENELLIVCSDSALDSQCDNLYTLEQLLDAWEINHRAVNVTSSISPQLLESSSLILVDSHFLNRPLTLKEKYLLYSLQNRTVVFSGIEIELFSKLFIEEEPEILNYIMIPLHASGSPVYYELTILESESTYIWVNPLTNSNPKELFYNILVRALFFSGRIPVREPFFSLEIDDCAMYETEDTQGEDITANFKAYENSVHLANSYHLKPIYGFTTSYFPYNPEIEDIFSFLKKNNVLVANHGYCHCLNFADSHTLVQDIRRANEDIKEMWGESPQIILVPVHDMCQESIVRAARDTYVTAVGSADRGYDFGVIEGILFYKRTSLQLYSNAVDDAPPFCRFLLYCKPFQPSVYAVTHIFNYIKKGAAYQYIDDALHYLTDIGYEPSDTETMVEEDFFWNFVDLESSTKGDTLIIRFSGLENLPRKMYIIHFMLYGTPSFVITADSYSVRADICYKDNIMWVTVTLQPEIIKRSKRNLSPH